ncbi:LysR family transcriptional regulator [Martelella sp. FOR1707]
MNTVKTDAVPEPCLKMRFLLSRQYQHFSAVYRQGNLRKASQVAGVTQPALTKSIRQIEETIGAKLFERTPQGMTPTAAAERLHALYESFDQQSRYTQLELAEILTDTGPQIRIGAGFVWAWHRLSDVIGDYVAAEPSVRVKLTTGITDTLLPQLENHEIDIAVCDLQGIIPPAGYVSRMLWSTERRLWARASHPLAGKKGLTLEDLSTCIWTGYSTDTRMLATLERQFRHVGLKKPVMQVESSSLMAQLNVMANSEFVGVIADDIAAEASRRGLVPLDFTSDDWALHAGVIFPREAENQPAFRHLLALLQKR